MKPYIRKPNYYETDQMGVIHHSNYIRWFEEARIDYMDQIGNGYAQLEQVGVIIPVLEVTCQYRGMVRFGDTVAITTVIEEYTGTRLTISYKVVDAATGEVRTTGSSRHCFINKAGRPVSLKKVNPEYDAAFRRVTGETE